MKKKDFGLFPLYYKVEPTSWNSLYRSTGISDSFCASYMFNSIEPKRSFETNISKKGIIPATRDFGPLFLMLSSMTNLRKQIIRVQKVF